MLQPQDSKIKVDLTKCRHSKSVAITDECTFKKHEEIIYKNVYIHALTFLHISLQHIHSINQISIHTFKYKELITTNGFLKLEFKRSFSSINFLSTFLRTVIAGI